MKKIEFEDIKEGNVILTLYDSGHRYIDVIVGVEKRGEYSSNVHVRGLIPDNNETCLESYEFDDSTIYLLSNDSETEARTKYPELFI